jgi:hypothetical protein
MTYSPFDHDPEFNGSEEASASGVHPRRWRTWTAGSRPQVRVEQAPDAWLEPASEAREAIEATTLRADPSITPHAAAD